MKLTQGKLIETIRKKNHGWTTYQARKIAGISIRRVNQVWKHYRETKEISEIGRKNGRLKRYIEDWETATGERSIRQIQRVSFHPNEAD